MNEYLKAFQDVAHSVDSLIAAEKFSPEVTQSATRLKGAIQPCIEELKQSAVKLKELVQVSFDELDHAEDVWNSKLKIAEAPNLEIWEQIGELSSRAFRVQHLGRKCKYDTVHQAKSNWEQRMEALRKKWFLDARQQPKKGVGFGEKEGFSKDIWKEVNTQNQELNLFVRNGFSLILHELELIQTDLAQKLISLMNSQEKADVTNRFELTVNQLKIKFSNPPQYLPDSEIFITGVRSDLKDLLNTGFSDVSWKHVEQFKERTSVKIEARIISLFDNRIELANQATSQTVKFYNDFLERQKQYQEETPEQRLAEKDWISQQRSELEQVQYRLEAILEQSAEY